jgi:hypothetical protein
MISMASTLLNQQLLSPNLAEDITKIARATYTAQWGVEEPPTIDQAEFTAQNAARVITELNTLASKA